MSRTAWLAPLVVMLAACGGTSPSPTEPTTAPPLDPPAPPTARLAISYDADPPMA